MWGVKLPVAQIESLQVKIFFKILSYDTQLPASTGAIRLAFIYPTNKNPGSLTEVFHKYAAPTINNRKIEVLDIAYDAVGTIKGKLPGDGVYALFVAATTPLDDVNTIVQLAGEFKALTFVQDPAGMERGAAASLEFVDERPRIIFNMKVLRQTHSTIDEALVKLARVTN
jgi:hypothetical protein